MPASIVVDNDDEDDDDDDDDEKKNKEGKQENEKRAQLATKMEVKSSETSVSRAKGQVAGLLH